MHGRRKWQPTPEFLPGKSHGQWSLAGLFGRDAGESFLGKWNFRLIPGFESCNCQNSSNKTLRKKLILIFTVFMFLYASPPTPALWCVCSPWQLLESSVAVAFESGSPWQCVLQSWVSSPLASGAASKLTTPIRAQNWSALLWIECSCSPTKSTCSKLTLRWWCQEVRSLGGDEATRVEPPWWD